MRLVRSFATRSLDLLVSFIPIKLANSLEWRIQKVQGKGIGYGSLRFEIRTIFYFLKKIGIDNPVIFDVGANEGQYALECISQNPRVVVHSFEPSVTAFGILQSNSQEHSNWLVHNIGMGSAPSTMKLYFDSPGSASASVVKKESVSGLTQTQDFELVEIQTINNFISKSDNIIPDVLKIDIEGFELSCLQGSLDYLDLIKVVQFEFGQINIDSRVFFRDYWNFFSERGFSILRVTAKNPIYIYGYREDLETFAVTNYIALNSRFFG
jgi:FkbM family methyltransferase